MPPRDNLVLSGKSVFSTVFQAQQYHVHVWLQDWRDEIQQFTLTLGRGVGGEGEDKDHSWSKR